MTINQLHKLSAKLIEQGAGRRQVAVDKSTFTHRLESDGACVINVEKADLKVIETMDDDGGFATTADGRVKSEMLLVIEGGGES